MALIKRFRWVGATDIGLGRRNNEDNFLIDHDLGLFLVADGVGGHMAGEIASAAAVASIRKSLLEWAENFSKINSKTVAADTAVFESTMLCSSQPSTVQEREAISEALDFASNAIFEESQRLMAPVGRTMGTTIAGIYFHDRSDGGATVFNVGDSRLYVFRDGKLKQMSTDHSAYQQWLSQGRPGPAPSRNIILQALGQSPTVTPSLEFEQFVPGDLLLMCTDGLTDSLEDAILTRHLSTLDRNMLETACENIINEALAMGGADNITVLLGEFT
jgi:serine/threonine protein phosphatase PrpC